MIKFSGVFISSAMKFDVYWKLKIKSVDDVKTYKFRGPLENVLPNLTKFLGGGGGGGGGRKLHHLN